MNEYSSRWQQPARVALINVAVFVVLVLGIEGTIRMLNPDISAVGTDANLFEDRRFGESGGPRPGATGRSNGVLRRVDDRGLWTYSGANRDRPKWLLLGDSVTMGLGVEGDSTFGGILASDQDSIDVVSPAIPGHASDDYLRIARVLTDTMDVGRITVFWCLNDVMAGRPVETAPQGARVMDNRLMSFLRRHVRTYTWAKAAFTDRPRLYFEHDAGLYEDGRGYLEAAIGDLEALQDIADARSIPLDVVLLPYEYGLRTGADTPRRIMAERLAERGIRAVDAGRALRSADDPAGLYLYGDGIHFNEKGHRAIAAFTMQALRE
ncbi:MAG: SGNH/GDSL hydrolase family protein [Rhodothermales bacterium]|nr:SGNH/GDSL hydrolase family protein [Rhodothermales bacterium]